MRKTPYMGVLFSSHPQVLCLKKLINILKFGKKAGWNSGFINISNLKEFRNF